MKYKGRIVDITKRQKRIAYVKSNVRKEDQNKFRNFPGGEGTYITGGEYLGTSLDVKIYIFDLDFSLVFDIYEQILGLTGYKIMPTNLLEKIESHRGEKVELQSNDGKTFYFNAIQLLS